MSWGCNPIAPPFPLPMSTAQITTLYKSQKSIVGLISAFQEFIEAYYKSLRIIKFSCLTTG